MLAERIAGELRRRRFARGALRVESPEAAFSFDGDGGIADAWLDAEPARARARRGADDPRQRGRRRLPGRPARGGALPRTRAARAQSIIRLATALAELGVPTPPTPEAESLTPRAAALLAGEISERVQAYVGSSGRGRFAFPSLVLRALKQARYDPANLGHSGLAERRLLPLHVADPPLPGSRLPPRAAARRRRRGRSAAGRHQRGGGADLDARAASGGGGVRRRRHLPRVAPRAAAVRERLGRDLRRRDHRLDRRRPVRAVRRRIRGIRPRADDPRRLLRADAARHRPQGRRGGRVFRLGDPLTVRVEEVRRMEGKVELRLASR